MYRLDLYLFYLLGRIDYLEMGPTDCPETSVINYHYWLRNSPEERSSHLLGGGSLKSRINIVCSLQFCFRV